MPDAPEPAATIAQASAAAAAETPAPGTAPRTRQLSAAPTIWRCDLCPDGGPLSWDAIAPLYRENYLLIIKGAADDTAEKPISLAALAEHYEQQWAIRQ